MTFLCDETMVITIPIGMKDMPGGHCMPQKFHCVYKDSYKVFVNRGKPKPLGAAQAIGGVVIIALTTIIMISKPTTYGNLFLFSLLFVVSGLFSFAAGKSPNMPVTKLSFALNIICFIWSVVASVFNIIHLQSTEEAYLLNGTYILILVLLVTESIITLYLTYWFSKAPVILLKRGD